MIARRGCLRVKSGTVRTLAKLYLAVCSHPSDKCLGLPLPEEVLSPVRCAMPCPNNTQFCLQMIN